LRFLDNNGVHEGLLRPPQSITANPSSGRFAISEERQLHKSGRGIGRVKCAFAKVMLAREQSGSRFQISDFRFHVVPGAVQ